MLHKTLADQVATELHAAILQGEFPGGSALRIQDLADRYATSPMPVRDALRRLEGLGLVEILPRRGARVLEFSLADLLDTYTARAEIESLAVRLAAQQIDADAITRAAAALTEHNRAIEAGLVEDARQAHRQFHFTLYEAAGSEWLLRSIDPAWRNGERYRFAAPSGDVDHQVSASEHQQILDACAGHDPEAASDAMRRHILGAGIRISSLLGRAVTGDRQLT